MGRGSRRDASHPRRAGPVILADTSAWIEYLRATGSAVHLRLAKLIADKAPIAVTDLVLMEILAGARDDAHRNWLRRLLAGCQYLPTDGPTDHERAADLYRRCRTAGFRVAFYPDENDGWFGRSPEGLTRKDGRSIRPGIY